MKKNVLDHEPHLALFVADNDPLIFYKVIAERGYEALLPNGKAIVEINERFGESVRDLFIQARFTDVRILQDFQGKDRIVTAVKA